jgi:hypothetical protein
MGNNLNIDLTGQYVILNEDFTGSPIQRVFRCDSGFGCSSYTMGNAVFGEFVFDGEKCRVEGFQIERLATAEEVKEANKIRAEGQEKQNGS